MSNRVYFSWREPDAPRRFRSGVSLHSHTLHSREPLDFLGRAASRLPALRGQLDAMSGWFLRHHGVPLDLGKGWWTPPLGPEAALELEAGQIEGLGLRPFVSLTDHDNLDAHRGGRNVTSVELTVPLRPSFLHLGVHNLPPARAHEVLAYRTHPSALLGWLNQFRSVLVVLNHPLWDEAQCGRDEHRAMVERFLARHEGDIHALELNGLRPWKENVEVMALAKAWDLPTISGGDRHGVEPNANLNLTNAETFDEFVEQVRYRRVSEVLFLPQYRRPHALRMATNFMDIVQEQEAHALGWRRWPDRVFYEAQPGVARPLADYWPKGEPAAARLLMLLVQALRTSGRLAPVRLASGLLQECRP